MAATETSVTATVTKVGRGRKKAKQEDLPTMKDHQRKIAELEDLGDVVEDFEQQLSDLKEKHKDAMENLVASMRRHDKTFYQRQTWGKIVLKESKLTAKVTKETIKPSDGGDEGESSIED